MAKCNQLTPVDIYAL